MLNDLNDTRRWDIDWISDILSERDTNLILFISLNNDIEDNWYWKHEKLGIYSVKSAYFKLRETRRSNQNDNAGYWRKLLNLKIPLKVKKKF